MRQKSRRVRRQRGLSPAGRGQAQDTTRVQKPPRHEETTLGSWEVGQAGSSGMFAQAVALVGNEAKGVSKAIHGRGDRKGPKARAEMDKLTSLTFIH